MNFIKNNKSFLLNRRGMAGIIIAVIVLSMLMLFSTSITKMVQTEIAIQSSVDHSKRAMDAAFSGVQYAISFMQTQREIYKSDQASAKKRIYFVTDPTDITTIWPPTLNLSTYRNKDDYPNLRRAFWIYLDQNIEYLYGMTTGTGVDLDGNLIIDSIDEIDAADTDEKEYQFRALSYPIDTAGQIDTNYFLVKSQGKYIVFNDDDTTSDKEFKFQIIAKVKIQRNLKKQLKLESWKRMKFQEDADFEKFTAY
jgi:hypothetical protein